MILDTTSKTIEVVLGGAITTNQLEITADWADTANGLTFAPGGTSLLTNGVTAVTAVASPAANVQRQVKALCIYNADTVNATVTVRMFDGTNHRRFVVVTLTPGQSLVWSPEFGWEVLPAAPVTMSQISDYAVGTWTPTAVGDGGGGSTTYTGQIGTYTKIGRQVFAHFDLSWSAFAGWSGNLDISGLPFTSNAINYGTIAFAQIQGITFAAGQTMLSGRVNPGATQAYPIDQGSGANPNFIPVAHVAATGTLIGVVIYHT